MHVDDLRSHVDCPLSLIDGLLRHVDNLPAHVDSVLLHAEATFAHVDSLPRHVDELSRVVDDLSRHVDELSRLVEKLSRLVANLSRLVANLSRVVEELSRVVEVLSRLVANLSRVVEELSRLVRNLSRLVANLSCVVEVLSRLVRKLSRLVRNLSRLVRKLSRIVANLFRLVRKLSRPVIACGLHVQVNSDTAAWRFLSLPMGAKPVKHVPLTNAARELDYICRNMQQHLGHPVFKLVAEKAAIHNTSAYVVGGYVRDIFLNRPSKDIDIVVLGDGIELAHAVAEALPGKPQVNFFKTFGTAMIKAAGYEIEFVGARKESYVSHSRKPEVEPGTLADDQNRRDFTINALAISLNKADYGQLIDPFNGTGDLKLKSIRTPLDPDITFSDDPLRMMRAIRFATQLDFTITPETLEAIKRNAERLKIVSQERITDELNKIILSAVPSVGFKLLFDTGLLELFFPELTKMQGVKVVNGKAHKDNFYHTLQVLDQICAETDDLWLRWSAILHDIAKPLTQRFVPADGWTFHGHEDKGARMVPGIFRRMKLPMNEKMKFVEKMVLLHLRPKALAESEVTDSAMRRLLFEAGDDLDALFVLCRADITSRNMEKVQRYRNNLAQVEQQIREVEARDQIRNWQPPVTGEDIMQTFAIGPGREVGMIKNSIRDAILDGIIGNSREQAWELMLNEGKKLGLVPGGKS